MRTHSSPRHALIAAALFVLAVTSLMAAQSAAPSSRSVRDGVFTAAQAASGGSLYEEKCSSCHAARMWGEDWPEKSVFDVYDTIKNFMPEDNPGSLTPKQTRDIVAYILRQNRLPTGKVELPDSEEGLKLIRIELPQ